MGTAIIVRIHLKTHKSTAMSKADFTAKELRYIMRHYRTKPSRVISEKLGRHLKAVTNFLRRRGLEIPRELNRQYQKELMSTHNTATAKTDRYIRKNYLTRTQKEMAVHVGRSRTFVSKSMQRMGLVIPDDIREQRIQSSRFHKGQVSHNKGKPMPAHVYEMVKDTMFKPGNLPHNTRPEGDDYVVRRDTTTGAYYAYYRKKLGEWVLYHRYIWEQANGPIPDNMVVSFIDGNTMNIKLSNLQLITKAELATRNRKKYPEDTRRMGMLVKKLQKLVNAKENRAVKK